MSRAFSVSIDNDHIFFLLWTIMTSMVDYTDKSFRILFWLHWVFVAAHWRSLIAVSGGYRLVAVRGLLIAVASLVAAWRL